MEQLTPRSERLSWLWLQWMPGWPYEPVQRFGVYEILPPRQVETALNVMAQRGASHGPVQRVWDDLKGPDPRTKGAFYKRDGIERFRGHQTVSYPQWRAHQATGGLPMLCWIIEGHRGGHAWQFGPFERAMLELGGLNSNDVTALLEAMPRPGDEPYADFDRRVLAALATRDRLYRMAATWEQRVGRSDAADLVERDEADARVRFAKEWMQWVENQISALVSDIPRTQVGKFMESARPDWEDTSEEDSLTEDLILGDTRNDGDT